MRHPRFPEAYGIIVAIARFIGAVTAIANMVLAAMLAARASPRRGASSAIAVVSGLALVVDVPVLVAMLDPSRKIPRPTSGTTGCVEVCLFITLLVTAFVLVFSNFSYYGRPEGYEPESWQDFLYVVVVFTFSHCALRFCYLVWTCIWGCVSCTRDRREERRVKREKQVTAVRALAAMNEQTPQPDSHTEGQDVER